jgi:hypothetical protein
MKNIQLFILLFFHITVFAQKETYDIVRYTPLKNWKKEINTTFTSYSRIDGGSWSQIAIYKSTASKGNIEEDSQSEWNNIVLSARPVQQEEKTKAESAEGWSVMSRSGVWQHNGVNVASILTTYSNGKVCLSILCNATAQPYLKDFQKLISSVKLDATTNTATVNNSASSSIIGLWTKSITETDGYLNGLPMTRGGYMRKEYLFHADGTYEYRAKNWSTTIKHILFIRETGTYSVNGNQLTITPRQGKGEWWSKANNDRTEGWGSFQEKAPYPLEKAAYTFEIRYLSGMGENYLILISEKETARDGKQSNRTNVPHEFNYSRTDTNKSLIDNPPSK